MALENDKSWKSCILFNLQARNKRELQFSEIINYHENLFNSVDILRSENASLTKTNERLKLEHEQAQSDKSMEGSENEKLLQKKILELQEEVTNFHRNKSENVQQLVDLNQQVLQQQKDLFEKDSKIGDLEALTIGIKEDFKQLESEKKELDSTNQIIRDEYQALHLAYTSMEEKYNKLQKDYNELLDRWMNQKSKDADMLNAENEVIYRKKQEVVKNELAEAAKENKTVSLPAYLHDMPLCFTVSLPDHSHSVDAHDSEVNAARWSLSGRYLATGGGDRKLKIWEYAGGQCILKGTYTGSNAAVTSVDFDYEEGLVLGSSNDMASRVWSVNDQRLRHTYIDWP